MDSAIVISAVFAFRDSDKFLSVLNQFEDVSLRLIEEHQETDYLNTFCECFSDVIDFDKLTISLPVDHYPEPFWPVIIAMQDACDTGHTIFSRAQPLTIGCWVDGIEMAFDQSNISELVDALFKDNQYLQDLIFLPYKAYKQKYPLSDQQYEQAQLLEYLRPKLLSLWSKKHGCMNSAEV